MEKIAAEKKERSEEMQKKEARREMIHEENRKDRDRRHNEQMEVQRSLVSILQQFLNKT